ncbi:MAG: hypothetical protein ACHQNE_00325, partial [Candidatus Kapaibacterium sp.]
MNELANTWCLTIMKRPFCVANSAAILMVLLSFSPAKSQWYAGANARMLTDAKSFGGAIEGGKQFSFGWIFLQGAFIDRRFDYIQTFSAFIDHSGNPFEFAIGPGSVSFPGRLVVGGVAVAAGLYTAKTSTAYFPLGPQYVVSATYCYPVFSWLMFGPTIGIA